MQALNSVEISTNAATGLTVFRGRDWFAKSTSDDEEGGGRFWRPKLAPTTRVMSERGGRNS
jgi:hypothetical protein